MARRGRKRKDPNFIEDATDQHIILQLRSAIDLKEKLITFKNGDTLVVKASEAESLVSKYMDSSNQEKLVMQEILFESADSFRNFK